MSAPSASPSSKLIVDHATTIRRGILAVKKLVKANKSIISAEDGDKQTFLHLAATDGDIETMNWLLKHVKQQDLKRRDKTGWTPLHAAAHLGKLDIYEALLRKGASPNAQNAHLTSPFAYLCRHGPPADEALDPQFLAVLELSLERGADLNSQNTNGDTPLFHTCLRGMVSLSKWLVSKGAYVNTVNVLGETPLHKAVQCLSTESSFELVKLLVAYGADISVCGLTGSPLTLAMLGNNQNVIDHLKAQKKLLQSVNEHSSKVKENYRVRTNGHLQVGPSYDNIDLATLLGIRMATGSHGSYTSSDKPGPDDIVESNEGFNFETGTVTESNDDLADLRIEDDSQTFDYRGNVGEDVVNILGVYRTPGLKSAGSTTGKNQQDEKSLARRFFCITVLRTPENGKFRGLLRTQTGDHRFYIPTTVWKDRIKPTPKDILKELQKEIPELDSKGICKCIIVDNPSMQSELVSFEENKAIQASRMKIGILYTKKGQKTEEEIFGNEHGSPEFEEFLNLLGDIIKLEGWDGFKGDLDVKNNRTGAQSLFTKFRQTEIMFHVATFLPHSDSDEQQIAKKRCIGNDLTTIIYLEEGAVFKPPTVSGDFLHIFAAVQPTTTKEGKKGFRVAFSSRDGVPAFGPVVPKPAIFEAQGGYFRDFILTKLLNGERAALHSPFLISKMYKTRQMFLDSLVQQFAPNLDEN